MANDEQLQQTAPGGHYSGHNKIPTIGQLLERLDRDKKDRDRELDQQQSAGGPVAHKNAAKRQSVGQKTVTDPTTGKQVVIEVQYVFGH